MPAFFVSFGGEATGGGESTGGDEPTGSGEKTGTNTERWHQMIRRYTFSKEERLTSATTITRLFESGHSLVAYPLKVVWMASPGEHPFPAQVAFAVSRRIFRRAVDRNLLKRRMREAWRLHKPSFYEACGENKVTLMVIYIAREPLPMIQIEKAMVSAINRISARKIP